MPNDRSPERVSPWAGEERRHRRQLLLARAGLEEEREALHRSAAVPRWFGCEGRGVWKGDGEKGRKNVRVHGAGSSEGAERLLRAA